MNYLLNRPNYPFNDVKIPDGLEHLLNDISRQVLKTQPKPEGIYDCIATYLEKLLNTRDALEGVEDILTGIINKAADIAQTLRNDGLDHDKANTAAEVVRHFFEKYIEEKRKRNYVYSEDKVKQVDIIVELMNKCKLSEIEVLRSQSTIFKAYNNFLTNYFKALESVIIPPDMLDCATQLTIDRYIKEIPSIADLTKAANIIKAAFKGHMIRQKIKDFNYLVNQASVHTTTPIVRSKRYGRSKSEMEVVLLILTYWNSTASSDRLQRTGTLKSIVKSVNERDLRNFIRFTRLTPAIFSSDSNYLLTAEEIAAIKIQKFSIVQPISAFSNLLAISNYGIRQSHRQSEE